MSDSQLLAAAALSFLLTGCGQEKSTLLDVPRSFTLGPFSGSSSEADMRKRAATCNPIEGDARATLCDVPTKAIPWLAARPVQKILVIFQRGKVGAIYMLVKSDTATISDVFQAEYGKPCDHSGQSALDAQQWCFKDGNMILTNRGQLNSGSALIYLQDGVLQQGSASSEIIDLLGEPIG